MRKASSIPASDGCRWSSHQPFDRKHFNRPRQDVSNDGTMAKTTASVKGRGGQSASAQQARNDGDSRSRQRLDKLKSELEQKEEELAMMSIQLAERNAMLGELKKQASKMLRSCDQETKPQMQELIQGISRLVTPTATRQTFDEWFDESQRQFIQKLSRRFPSLTPMELKVCSLLRNNLRSREIANLLHMSVRSVESHRYWIRKKLDLPSSSNLVAFLTAL